jgi:hypothetical protein
MQGSGRSAGIASGEFDLEEGGQSILSTIRRLSPTFFYDEALVPRRGGRLVRP